MTFRAALEADLRGRSHLELALRLEAAEWDLLLCAGIRRAMAGLVRASILRELSRQVRVARLAAYEPHPLTA